MGQLQRHTTIFSSAVISLLIFKGKSKLWLFRHSQAFYGPPLFTGHLYTSGSGWTLGILFLGYPYLPLYTCFSMREIIGSYIRLTSTLERLFWISTMSFISGSFPWGTNMMPHHSFGLYGIYLACFLFELFVFLAFCFCYLFMTFFILFVLSFEFWCCLGYVPRIYTIFLLL